MNFFLVVLRCSIDDLPLLATTDEEEAMRFAEAATEDSAKQAADVLSLDISEPSNVSVWLFAGGKLIGSRVVKDFQE